MGPSLNFKRRTAARSDGSAADLCLLGTMLGLQRMAGAGLATANVSLQCYRLESFLRHAAGYQPSIASASAWAL